MRGKFSRRGRVWSFGRSMLRSGSDRGFTIAELGVVIILVALLLMVTIIVFYTTTRKTDIKAAAEMMKQDIRKTYALADSGETDPTHGERYRYRIEFHTGAEDPPNAYRILKQTYNGSSWATSPWTVVTPERHESYKTVGNGWIKFSSSGDTKIESYTGMSNLSTVDGNHNGITFISKGSIIETATSGDKTVTISDGSGSDDYTITVSQYGSVSD